MNEDIISLVTSVILRDDNDDNTLALTVTVMKISYDANYDKIMKDAVGNQWRRRRQRIKRNKET